METVWPAALEGGVIARPVAGATAGRNDRNVPTRREFASFIFRSA